MSSGDEPITVLPDVPDDPDIAVTPEDLESPGVRLLREIVLRRPMIFVAAALVIGICLQDALPIKPATWAGMAIVAAVVGLILRHRPWAATIALLAAVALAGVTVAQREAFFYPADHVARYVTDTPRIAQLELYIDEPPRIIAGAFGQFRALPPKQVTLATVTRVKTWNGWVPASGQTLVQIAQPHPRLAAGQTVQAIGLLQRPSPAVNPGQFDWAKYYRDQRVLVSLQIVAAGNIHILDQSPAPVLTRFREYVRQLLAAGFPAARSLDHALLRALLLGDSDPELRDVQDQFRHTGTSHHLSLSGFHVAVLAGVVLLMCRLAGLSPRWTAGIAIGFAVMYGFLVLPSPSAVRAVLLCVAVGVAALSRRGTDSLQLLAVAAMAMLVYHPLDLFSAGFVLGYCTVLGLILLTPPAMATVLRWRGETDDFGRPYQSLPKTRWGRTLHWSDRYFTYLFVAGVVAWAVSLPLIAILFEQLNPWAVPAGIVLAPFVLVALIGGMMKVLFTLAWPGLAGMWATMAAWPIAGTRHVVDWLALMPGSDVPLPAPPVWAVVFYYACLIFLVWPTRKRKRFIIVRAAPAAICLAVIFAPLVTGRATTILPARSLRLTLLAIGAGQTAVLETPGDRTLLFDCGSMTQTDLVRKTVGPLLRRDGERTIDSIVLSHGDYDHISGVADTVAAYDVREIFTGPRFRLHAVGVPPTEAMLRTLDQTDHPPRTLTRGDSIPITSDVQLDVLWPPKTATLNSNNDALVTRVSFAGQSILFTGDIQEDAEKALLEHPEELKASVLIAPHHGSSERTTPAFIRAVDPQCILSSNDRSLTGKQKAFETMTDGHPLYRTNRCGAITVTIDADGKIEVTPFLAQPAR